MSEERHLQEVSVGLTDDIADGLNMDDLHLEDGDIADGLNMDDLHMEDGNSLSESSNASGESAAEQTQADNLADLDPDNLLSILAMLSIITDCDNNDSVFRGIVNLADEIEQFILGQHQCFKNVIGRGLSPDVEELLRDALSNWNAFHQWKHGVQGNSAIISSDINQDIKMFIGWKEAKRGEQCPELVKRWFKRWLPRWNLFLEARAGETLVTRFNLFLTIVGFLLYMLDLGSDIATAIYFASNAQWWQATVTLAFVYTAVIVNTVVKWRRGQIHCTGAVDWLRYVASSLVNWPELKYYGAFSRLEWQLHKSPVKNAHLVPDWHQMKINVTLLKLTEGLWEACPQAILQLCLLVPDLYGAWTWTVYLRIVGACVSLCTAGAALVDSEKFGRISIYTDLPPRELVVLHMWAVPLAVSRLLSVALVLSVHLYWALAGVALHLVLYGVYWCRTLRIPRVLGDVISMYVDTLMFFISPFRVAGSMKYRRVSHAIHLLVNTAVTVVWALGTPLVCANPALYTAIICSNAVMFAVGLVGWQLHEKHWPDSYLIRHNHRTRDIFDSN